MSIDLKEALQLALATAREAGALIKEMRNAGDLQRDYKGQQELVTNADIAADQLIIERIKSRYPDHEFLTEETLGNKADKHDLQNPIWIIDPIDGTVNYAHGQQMVAVSIAFGFQGEVQIGVVYNPFLDELFCAQYGRGATLNGTNITPSDETNLRKAVFATGFPYDKSGVPPILKRIESIIMHTQDMRRLGSAALDICWVACGRLDIYFESLSLWDFAAARLIALEAGATCGHFSDVPDNVPPCIHNKDLLITTPALFDGCREILVSASTP
jgi:myo-inositol-1(or 4)-monophosphatase